MAKLNDVRNKIKDKGEVEVVNAEPVSDVKDVVDLVKAQNAGGGTITSYKSELAEMNPEFDGLDQVRPNTIKKDADEFIIYTAETGEETVIDGSDGIVGILQGGRVARTIWDESAKKFYLTYDEKTAVTGEDWQELLEKHGKSTFRYHFFFLMPDMSDEPYSFLGSGSSMYALRDYAKKLLEKHKLKLTDVYTKITLKKKKSDKGTYYVEQFEFVKPVEEKE